MRILILGLNHRTAPVEIRERLAFPAADQPSALGRLIQDYKIAVLPGSTFGMPPGQCLPLRATSDAA